MQPPTDPSQSLRRQRVSRAFGEVALVGGPTSTYSRRGLIASEGLFGFAILVVLRKESPEIVDFLFVLDPCKSHFGAGDLGLRVLDVFLELSLIPGDAGILVGI